MKRIFCGLLLGVLAAGAAAASPDCRVPEDLVADDPQLPQLSQHLKQKQPVTIVVIGGATTAGTAAAKPEEEAYPRRLEAALRQRHPEVPITVLNRGVPRQTTQQMVERFARDVFPLAPTLVIWETGTYDAARGVEVDAFAAALEEGLAQLREHKLDIMLVNMQYSWRTASVINFEPYLAAMQQRADVEEIYLFRRFEMMRYWSENGVFHFGDVPVNEQPALAAQVYACLGERLADAVDYAAR